MEKNLDEILKIKKNDVISITGSGGKTSLMFYLANILKKKGSVLITTSTKIKVPEKDQVDELFLSFDSYEKKDYKNFESSNKENKSLDEIFREKNYGLSKDFFNRK